MFLFYLEYFKTLFLVLFSTKTRKEKNRIFWPNPWLTPLQKMQLLGL